MPGDEFPYIDKGCGKTLLICHPAFPFSLNWPKGILALKDDDSWCHGLNGQDIIWQGYLHAIVTSLLDDATPSRP